MNFLNNGTPILFIAKCALIILLGVICAIYFIMMPTIAQANGYHHFADQRTLWGIANFWNVVSNVPIMFFSAVALGYLCRDTSNEHFIEPKEKIFYFIFFIATFLAGICSSYYHWNPDNATILYDRLPLVVAFPCFFATLIGERINLKLGFYLLLPFILLGMVLILYWYYSEHFLSGGDLRPYYFGEWFILLAIPLLVLLFSKSPYTENKYLWLAIIFFGSGRIIEKFDTKIYVLLDQTLSGHTIKHFLAGFAVLFVFLYIRKRNILLLEERAPVPLGE